MRSWWAVSEASRSRPGDGPLADLAEAARKLAEQGVAAAMQRVAKREDDAEADAALLYAALALRDDADLRARALKLLTSGTEQTALDPVRLLAKSLLEDRGRLDHAALSEFAAGDASGEDVTVLTALACRRAGADVWQTFRANAPDKLGSQPLPGHAVVLIHRLSHDRLPITGDLP